MHKNSKLALTVLPLLLSLACTDPNKLPAESALKAAETAAATLSAEVSKLAPEAVKSFQDDLAAAKAAIAKQDFKGARTLAEALPSKAAAAVAAAKAKKDELKAALDEGTAKLGEKVTALQARIQELAKAKKLPAGVTKETVAKAKEAVSEIEAAAAKAKEQAGADLAAAAASLKELGAKATGLANDLKIP